MLKSEFPIFRLVFTKKMIKKMKIEKVKNDQNLDFLPYDAERFLHVFPKSAQKTIKIEKKSRYFPGIFFLPNEISRVDVHFLKNDRNLGKKKHGF